MVQKPFLEWIQVGNVGELHTERDISISENSDMRIKMLALSREYREL